MVRLRQKTTSDRLLLAKSPLHAVARGIGRRLNAPRAITALIAREWAFRQGACVLCRVPEIARISNRDIFQVGQVPWFTIEMPRCAIQRNDVGRVPFKPDCSGTSANAPVILHRIRRLLVTRDGAVRWRAASSLSDLSKNRDFLEYYVSRSPGTIVELRSDRYSF